MLLGTIKLQSRSMGRYAQPSAALSMRQPQTAAARVKRQVRIRPSGSFPSRKGAETAAQGAEGRQEGVKN